MKAPRKRTITYLSLVNGAGQPWQVMPDRADRLRGLVRMYYDMQKLRIAAGNRVGPTGEESEPYLDAEAKDGLDHIRTGFRKMELQVVKVVETALRDVPIARWLTAIDGVGPCMAGVLLSEVSLIPTDRHPEPFTTISKLWKFTGLHTSNGAAPRRKAGERAGFNPWLRSRIVAVLARNLIKTNTRSEPDEARLAEINARREQAGDAPFSLETWRAATCAAGFATRIEHPWMAHAVYVRGPWARIYYDYRHRKESLTVASCMGCAGTGRRADPDATAEEKRAEHAKNAVVCWNCAGTGGPAPWGRGADHRDQAAVRYLAKMFLGAFLNEYRKQESLVVRPPYAEEKLGAQPHRAALAPAIPETMGYVEAYRDEGGPEDEVQEAEGA